MKKVLSLILATLLVLTSVAAMAEAVPSKTTEDITVVTEAVAENGGAVEITVVDSAANEKVLEVLTTVVETVVAKEDAVTIYTEETQAAIAAKLPEGAALAMHEVCAIDAPAYEAEDGAVTAKFTFPTVYTAEQTLVAVVSLYTGEAVEEIVLDAVANEDGSVSVTFTADAMAKIAAADVAVLAILNTK